MGPYPGRDTYKQALAQDGYTTTVYDTSSYRVAASNVRVTRDVISVFGKLYSRPFQCPMVLKLKISAYTLVGWCRSSLLDDTPYCQCLVPTEVEGKPIRETLWRSRY